MALARGVTTNVLGKTLGWLKSLGHFWSSHPSRQLHLLETLTLGERRFLAVVEFERQKFLIAGTGSSVAMLSALSSDGIAGEHRATAIKPGARCEEIPTWVFTGEGPASQLIRR
jgi:hypothetical protein